MNAKMRLWLSKNSEVPVRDQLISQIFLGVISGDLTPGQKLPSTRELARRFHIHSNTVRAAYQDLVRRGWLEFRKGSGVYVRVLNIAAPPGSKLDLDQLISIFLHVARDSGHSLGDIQARVRSWLELQPNDHFLVIESDAELRKILVAEITQATGFPAIGAGLEVCTDHSALTGASPVALLGQVERVRALLPQDKSLTTLYLRSVTEWLAGSEPLPAAEIITVVSGWPDFLSNARSLLVAAGLDPDQLVLRHTSGNGWRHAIPRKSFVITDALTAGVLPRSLGARVFQVISDSSIVELRNHKKFLTGSEG